MGMRLQSNDTQSNDLHSNNARLVHKLFLPLHVINGLKGGRHILYRIEKLKGYPG